MKRKVTYEVEGGFEVEFDNAEDAEEKGISITHTYTQDNLWLPLDIWTQIVAAASNLANEAEEDE